MSRLTSIVFTTLTLFLGMFFFFIGLLKISPHLNRDIHREIRRNFVRYAKVVPFMSRIGVNVSPQQYRLLVGYSEVACGLILSFAPGTIKQMINILLILLMVGAIYTHRMVGDHVSSEYLTANCKSLIEIFYLFC